MRAVRRTISLTLVLSCLASGVADAMMLCCGTTGVEASRKSDPACPLHTAMAHGHPSDPASAASEREPNGGGATGSLSCACVSDLSAPSRLLALLPLNVVSPELWHAVALDLVTVVEPSEWVPSRASPPPKR